MPCASVEFSTEMDEVKEYLRSKKYSVLLGKDKGKKADFRRKCQAFIIHDDALKFAHKPNRKNPTGK